MTDKADNTADVRWTAVKPGKIVLLEHAPVPDLSMNVVLIVDANLACAGTTQSVHALAEGGVDEGRHVEFWREVGRWGGRRKCRC